MKFISTIKAKLIIISLLLLIIPLLFLGFFSYQKSVTSLDDLGAINLKNSVEITIEMIDSLNRQVEKGKMSLEEAQEEVKIAILGEKNADGTRPINDNFNLGENGYMFVLNQEGIYVADPQAEGKEGWEEEDINGSKIAQNMIKTGNDGGGIVYYDWTLPNDKNQIEKKITYAKTEPNWGWTVNASTYMMDFNASAKSILNLIFIVMGITLIIGIVIICIFANNISNPIKNVAKQMDLLANGDLTLEDVQIKTKDETSQLAKSLNNMKNGLKEIILNVSKATETISSQSEELTQASNEVMTGSEQIARTMEELGAGAETQANSASNLAFAMSNFSNKVQQTNHNGEQIEETSIEVLDLTKKGNELMNSSATQMEKINQIVRESVGKVEQLDVYTQEISGFISIINNIAGQTNLLSLNAQIEAARAGEHGKGFAVVADEVRKLAEQSSNSVTSITEIVNRIQGESSIVVSSLQDGYKEIEEGTNQITITRNTFDEINSSVNEMVERIKKITSDLADIAESNQEMNASIEGVASVSEEFSAGIEQTSATSQQSSSAMQEVTASSNDLARLAEELNMLVQRFKL